MNNHPRTLPKSLLAAAALCLATGLLAADMPVPAVPAMPAINTAAAKLALTFPMLSDPGSETIDACGVRNQEATGRAVGVPHPVIFLLDQAGVIHVKLMHDGYHVRPASEEIMTA